jgi:hypothetical protein
VALGSSEKTRPMMMALFLMSACTAVKHVQCVACGIDLSGQLAASTRDRVSLNEVERIVI